jgi:hypothetical protein
MRGEKEGRRKQLIILKVYTKFLTSDNAFLRSVILINDNFRNDLTESDNLNGIVASHSLCFSSRNKKVIQSEPQIWSLRMSSFHPKS